MTTHTTKGRPRANENRPRLPQQARRGVLMPIVTTPPVAPRRPTIRTTTELDCPVYGEFPWRAAGPPHALFAHGRPTRPTGDVILNIADATRMDELDALVLARALVDADTITIHGTSPQGVQNVERTLDTAMDQAAAEAELEALARLDAPTEDTE